MAMRIVQAPQKGGPSPMAFVSFLLSNLPRINIKNYFKVKTLRVIFGEKKVEVFC